MRSGTIAWLLGGFTLCLMPSLPDLVWLAIPTLLAVALAALSASRSCRAPMLALMGLLWTGWSASDYIDIRDQLESLPRDVLVEGVVVGIPDQGRRRLRFEMDVGRVNSRERWLPIEGRWRIDWYSGEATIQPGQRWRLRVRRSIRRSARSPGTFDLEKYLFRHNIAAVGYVRTDARNQSLGPTSGGNIDTLRQRLSQLIGSDLAGRPLAPLVAALAVGDRHRLTNDQRSVLAETGTAHLMAISGLHIGLVAGMGLLLGSSLWRSFPALAGRFPARLAGGAFALAAAGSYAALAGFALPTQRALIMLGGFMIALLCRRPFQGSHGLAVALLAVLVADPLSPLDPGFWLSFGAVACILWMFARRLRQPPPLVGWLGLQWGLLLFMLPTGLVFFGHLVPAAFLANLIAVPWVSVAVIPPVLGATAAAAAGLPGHTMLYGLGTGALEMLWPLLEWMSAWDLSPGVPTLDWIQLVAALSGVALLLAPTGIPGRALGTVLLVPVFFADLLSTHPAATVALLGGHGIAPVVVSAGDSALLVDTGSKGPGGVDPGRFLIGPYLDHLGVEDVDVVFLTGTETSRTGGLRSVRERSVVAPMIGPANLLEQVRGVSTCNTGEMVTTAHVAYDFPGADAERCPVRMTVMNRTILIPGAAAADSDWWHQVDVPDLLVLDPLSGSALPDSANRVLMSSGTVFSRGARDELPRQSVHSANRCGSLEWRLDGAGRAQVHCYAETHRRIWHRTR